MPASKAQQKAVNKYMKENYDRFLLTLRPKGRLETIKAHASAQEESTSAFINRAISEAMERDGGGAASETAGKRLESKTGGGVVPLPSETLEVAQAAAEATGEAPIAFIARAVQTQAERDKVFLKMSINPATGDKMKREA